MQFGELEKGCTGCGMRGREAGDSLPALVVPYLIVERPSWPYRGQEQDPWGEVGWGEDVRVEEYRGGGVSWPGTGPASAAESWCCVKVVEAA